MIRRAHRKRALRRHGKGAFYLDEITLLNEREVPGAVGGIHIGRDVAFGYDCWLNGYSRIVIGDRTLIGPRCMIHSANHEVIEGVPARDRWKGRPVLIGDDCWLGMGVIVLPGTVLGDRCVVGAGAILSGRYPADSVIYGEKSRAR